jgi:uncharacterized membrane protein YqgA involved in biofilm formation
MNIEGAFERFGEWLKIKSGNAKDKGFVNAFVTASLTVCIGAMAIVGSIQDGLTGDYSILITKSCLDLISSFMLASTLGAGVLLSAVSVLVIQGGLVLLSGLAAPLMSPEAIQEMTCAGSLMILMIGTNLLGITKIKVADFLPGILFAPLLCLLLPFFEKLKDLFF